MHTLLRPLLVAALSLFLGGCATIVKDDNQPVAFSSDPQGAIIAINGVPRGTTPTTIMVQRTRKKQMIEITKDGYQAVQFPLGKHIAGMTFGNIIFGGIIGLGVDYASGKGANYQDSVMVKLLPVNIPPAQSVAVTATDTPLPPTSETSSSPRTPTARIVVANNGLGLTVSTLGPHGKQPPQSTDLPETTHMMTCPLIPHHSDQMEHRV